MRTPITYYGGKQRIAGEIISMMPGHKLYCEPFFGGGAVFFAKPKGYLEVINDNNDNLITFYRQVATNFEQLAEKIDNSLCSESDYYLAKDYYNSRVAAEETDIAWAVWIITNCSFASHMQSTWSWCNGKAGSHKGIAMRNKRNEFNKALKNRLQNVQISCRDALRVIQDRDGKDTFFYLDPPYPGSYQGHYSGYTHKDFYELLQLLSDIKGKFILSNYWCQTLRYHILKHGWNYKSIEVSLRMTNLGRGKRDKGVQKRTEILVYNYDIEKNLFT